MTAPTAEAPEAGATDKMTLDQLIDQLSEVSDEHVKAGLSAVQSRAKEIRDKHAAGEGLSEGERKEAKSLKDAYGKLDAEKTKRDNALAELEADLADIPAAQAEEPTEEPEPKDAKTEEPAETTDAAEDTPEKAPEPVTASDTPRLKLGAITGKREPSQVAPARSNDTQVSIVAAAGDREHPAGMSLSPEQMYSAIFERQRRIMHDRGGSGDYITVATMEAPTRDDRHLKSAEEITNSRKLDAVTRPEAITASGGVCAPFTIDYSIGAIGSTARPVKAAFPQYTADRGGIQFRRDVDALGSGPVSATGTWSLEDDAAVGTGSPPADKPIWDVPCNTVISAEVQAVTLGLRFSNITNRFDPEAVAANTQAAMVAHARYAENLLLNSMYAQVTATFTQAAFVSGTRDLLAALDKTIAYARNNRRQGPEISLRTFLPYWIKDLIRTDMTRALHTSNEEWLAISDASINTWFANRNVNVTWMLDGRGAISAVTGPPVVPAMAAQGYAPVSGASAVAIPGYPDTLEFPLFAEGTFVYLDGGSLDLGVVRDQTLVQTNRYIQFQETFEGLYRKGVEALRCVVGVQPTGGSAGTINASSLAD